MRIIALLLLLWVVETRAAGPSNSSFASLLDSARTDYATGHCDAALAKLEQGDKAQGPSGESLDLRGMVLFEQGKVDAAEQAVNKAHKLQPELFAPRLHLGDIRLRQKKYAEAREIYSKLGAETNVLISNERVRYGLLLSALGLHDAAAAQTALANIKFPTETGAYYYAQAAAEFAHGNERSAKKWMATAREIFDPQSLSWFARPLYDFGWLKDKPLPPTL